MWPLAVCNELWRDEPIERIFDKAARLGYQGVEIAPFTLADSVEDIPAGRRREIRRAAESVGVEVVGLHWLFVSPAGLHLTSPDAAVRRRSADYLCRLAEFCADLGGKVMVFGSPQQRSFSDGETYEAAFARAVETLGWVAPTLRDVGVVLCFEALSPAETNFVNTAEQAVALVEAVGAAGAVEIMLDVKAMSFMPEGIEQTIRRFGGRARHFHANDPSGKGPGMGDLDFAGVLRVLKESGYSGWISVEPFDYRPDPDTVARVGIETLRTAFGRI